LSSSNRPNKFCLKMWRAITPFFEEHHLHIYLVAIYACHHETTWHCIEVLQQTDLAFSNVDRIQPRLQTCNVLIAWASRLTTEMGRITFLEAQKIKMCWINLLFVTQWPKMGSEVLTKCGWRFRSSEMLHCPIS
jgi:hypothetical protein